MKISQEMIERRARRAQLKRVAAMRAQGLNVLMTKSGHIKRAKAA